MSFGINSTEAILDTKYQFGL